MVKETSTLYFKDSKSDKFYQISIVEEGGKFSVPFVFGRRGTAGQTGDKVKGVTYEKAKNAYDSVIQEKKAKGYAEGEGVKPYAGTANAEKATGIHCQLLTEVDEKTEIDRLIRDPMLLEQEKFNGKRMLLMIKDGKITAINRRGLECGFPSEIETDAKKLTSMFGGHVLFDGECVGTIYRVFDVLESRGRDMREDSVALRVKGLDTVLSKLNFDSIKAAPTAWTVEEKTAMYSRVKYQKGEGVVFKRLDASYKAGITESWVKVKFWASASCVVTKVNDKRSVALGLLDDDKKMVGVGNCTIPANHDIPKAGEIVEVRYLYAHKGGSLVQPQYEGVRDDLTKANCKLSQLKYKPEGETDDEEA